MQKEGNNMSNKRIRLIAAIGASAVVMVGAVAVGVNQDRSSLGADAGSGMSTGALSLNPLRRKHLPSSGRRRASRAPPHCPPKNRAYPDRSLLAGWIIDRNQVTIDKAFGHRQ
jgi:hypothetical protein